MQGEPAARVDDGAAAPYRPRLALLAAGVVEELVAGCRPGSGEWRRIYGKLRPQRSPWALLVHQAGDGATVAVRLHESLPASARGVLLDAGGLGVAEVVPCAEDPAMPSLPRVLAGLSDPRVVRYHPGNRCIVRGRRDGATSFVKVFAEEVDDQHEARQRWEASLAGTLSFAVAEPQGWDDATRASWYGEVPGTAVEPVLADGGQAARALVRRVGACLGELAVSGLRPVAVDDDAHQLARTGRSLARAAAAAPGLAADLDRAAGLLRAEHARLGRRPLVPIHGAAHLGQWLVDDSGRLGLVDFDRFAMGEPEFDLATFLVEAAAVRGPLSAERLRDGLLDGYREVAGEVDEERLRVYLLHKRLGRVVRAAAGLRPGGPERAAVALVEVLADLGSEGPVRD